MFVWTVNQDGTKTTSRTLLNVLPVMSLSPTVSIVDTLPILTQSRPSLAQLVAKGS